MPQSVCILLLDPNATHSKIVGDFAFTAPRRAFSQAARVPSYAYLFGDHDAVVPPNTLTETPAPGSLGGESNRPHMSRRIKLTNGYPVTHSTEIFYVFGSPFNRTSSAVALSDVMMDYWISFATSLDPNDGLGNARMSISLTFSICCSMLSLRNRPSVDPIHARQRGCYAAERTQYDHDPRRLPRKANCFF